MPDADVLVEGLVPCPAGADGVRRRRGGRRAARTLRLVLRGGDRAGHPARGGAPAGGVGGGAPGRGQRLPREWPGSCARDRRGRPGDRRFAREPAGEVDAVRALVRDFGREAGHGESPVPFALVRDVLREQVRDVSGEPARLADGVTVAGLAPGRVFPAAVVCIAGMNDGAFPRIPSFPSFDLMAAGPARRGDRDIRHEDRFAFLEALLAARRCFLVSYTGRGLRDDAPIPPSVLVDELKDYLARRFPGATIETRHPLQPFSPRYFLSGALRTPGGGASSAGEAADPPADGAAEGGGDAAEPRQGAAGGAPGEALFSYSRGMCEAARAMLAGEQDPARPGRFAQPLPDPDESQRVVDPADLITFFANPARFFLRHRLGARLEVDDATLDEEEPFELDGLERYRLRSEVWSRMRAGAAPARTEALMSGRGRLPQAGLGRVVHEREWEEAEQLEKQLAPYRAALDAPSREVDFEIGGFRIVGALERIGPDGTMVWPRIGRLRARDRIEIWLRLLAWAAAGNGPAQAVGISREGSGKQASWKSQRFPAPECAGEQLERWLRARWRGLAAPLPFFPETSYAYAHGIARPGRHARRGRPGGRLGQGQGQVVRERPVRERPSAGGTGRPLSPPRPRRRPPADPRIRRPRGRASRAPHRPARGRPGTRCRSPAVSSAPPAGGSVGSARDSAVRNRQATAPAVAPPPATTFGGTCRLTGPRSICPSAAQGRRSSRRARGPGRPRAITTLVARLIVERGWRLDQILVVTFTRAATAELRDRIRRTLGGALAAARSRAAMGAAAGESAPRKPGPGAADPFRGSGASDAAGALPGPAVHASGKSREPGWSGKPGSRGSRGNREGPRIRANRNIREGRAPRPPWSFPRKWESRRRESGRQRKEIHRRWSWSRHGSGRTVSISGRRPGASKPPCTTSTGRASARSTVSASGRSPISPSRAGFPSVSR